MSEMHPFARFVAILGRGKTDTMGEAGATARTLSRDRDKDRFAKVA